MKLSSIIAVITSLALCASTTYSAETSVDDELIQQILDDPQLSDLLDDPDKLMDMLKEKLRIPSKTMNKCLVAVSYRHTIIRTRDSRAAGAVFLSSLSLKSPSACVDACCANSSCNTAVMKQKVSCLATSVN